MSNVNDNTAIPSGQLISDTELACAIGAEWYSAFEIDEAPTMINCANLFLEASGRDIRVAGVEQQARGELFWLIA